MFSGLIVEKMCKILGTYLMTISTIMLYRCIMYVVTMRCPAKLHEYLPRHVH